MSRHRQSHETIQMHFSGKEPISSWSKDKLKAELCEVNLEKSAHILHSLNVDGLSLLRACEKYDLVGAYNLEITDAIKIEAYAQAKQREDEVERMKIEKEIEQNEAKKRKKLEREEAEERKKLEKVMEMKSKRSVLNSVT